MYRCARLFRTCVSVALCGLVFLSTDAAFAGDGISPYIGIYGGMAFPESLDNVKGRGDLSGFTFSDMKLKSGPIVGVKLGIMGPNNDPIARWLGLEIDGSYTQSKIKEQTIQISAFGLTGNLPVDETKINLITGALHLIVKYPDGPFQPYVGAGPAVVHARVSDSNVFDSSNATALGFSGVGGFRLMFSEHIGLFAEYKYIRASLELVDRLHRQKSQ